MADFLEIKQTQITKWLRDPLKLCKTLAAFDAESDGENEIFPDLEELYYRGHKGFIDQSNSDIEKKILEDVDDLTLEEWSNYVEGINEYMSHIRQENL